MCVCVRGGVSKMNKRRKKRYRREIKKKQDKEGRKQKWKILKQGHKSCNMTFIFPRL